MKGWIHFSQNFDLLVIWKAKKVHLIAGGRGLYQEKNNQNPILGVCVPFKSAEHHLIFLNVVVS